MTEEDKVRFKWIVEETKKEFDACDGERFLIEIPAVWIAKDVKHGNDKLEQCNEVARRTGKHPYGKDCCDIAYRHAKGKMFEQANCIIMGKDDSSIDYTVGPDQNYMAPDLETLTGFNIGAKICDPSFLPVISDIEKNITDQMIGSFTGKPFTYINSDKWGADDSYVVKRKPIYNNIWLICKLSREHILQNRDKNLIFLRTISSHKSAITNLAKGERIHNREDALRLLGQTRINYM